VPSGWPRSLLRANRSRLAGTSSKSQE
jgi:hypothetical protein